MNKSLVNVPVLLVFFNKTDCFEQVFARIREAKPSKLYLCQDGPRDDKPDDVEKIEKCRKIAENIDWECEVHRRYSEVNLGCDPHIYSSLCWVFSNEEELIMIEDDGLVDVSFFKFAESMLDKYRYDERIALISSYNLLGTWECPYDYFFSNSGTLSGGWATWKRCWENRDDKIDFLDDEYSLRAFKSNFKNGYIQNDIIEPFYTEYNYRRKNNKPIMFEVIVATSRVLQGALTIVPTKNLMCNIGVCSDATHSKGNGSTKLSSFMKRIFFLKTYPITVNLKHPKYVICDCDYYHNVQKLLSGGFIAKSKTLLKKILKKFLCRKGGYNSEYKK